MMPTSYESKVLSARRSLAVAATTASDLGGTVGVGVLPSTSGNLIGTLVNDQAPQTFAVTAGIMYPLAFKSIDVTNAVDVVVLFN